VAARSIPDAPVEPPGVEPPEEDSAARERLAQLEQAAQAKAEREAAERAAVLTITRVHQQLSSGDLNGVSAILEEAAASLTGTAAEELRAATRSLENEDLATARQHLELALMSAR
jgi:tellurite resistance protein